MPVAEDPLRAALDIAEELLADGREEDALDLLCDGILPALDERLQLAKEASERR